MTNENVITNPSQLYSRSELLEDPSAIPATSGVYGWYFLEIPGITPIDDCIVRQAHTLLYVGISPDKISKPNSRQNIRKRILTHYKGNAEGSTLRRTLGVLLADKSGFPLRRVGTGKRYTLTHLGEQWLDQWMEENARVCWVTHPTPWDLEGDILRDTRCPLNIKDNKHEPFSDSLNKLRRTALIAARELPIANEKGTSRR
ncbi:MAG: hypothetical protein CL793_01905 [Chloroflexi bacterium]|nr:hypothetical protein [Chloroflexota bacterium]|tara:strand:- start:1586 stop:2188 length:603 start_codon:yes stop_codon:yes gene_type:complete